MQFGFCAVTPERLELSTQWLRVICSTNWATESNRFSISVAKVRIIFYLAMLFAIFFEKIFIFSIFHRGVIDFFMSFCCVGSVDGSHYSAHSGGGEESRHKWLEGGCDAQIT